ncbi:MAG: HlyD family efflux transporter periplasmic adaptor subunit [Proteobacteria bacterium]|nr:HlyD family efflux transporter periplasmic adaptor subunit [Pseudomonadota bacterium]MBU1649059.1 HlyD family efflux transporter periplasmic adaptor subunit [Pseudomonadota bacterium]
MLFCVLFVVAGCTTDLQDSYQGYVEGEYQLISSPLAGQLKILSVSRGATVAAGVSLFTLEHQSEAAVLSEAEQAVQRAENKLADLGKGLRPSEIASVKARLAQAEAAVNLASREFKRREKLFQENTISREELDRARKEMESSQAVAAQLTAEVKTAGLGARADEILAARADVKAAGDRLEQARWRVEQKIQKAPEAGYVFDTFYVAGEFVPAGYPVVSILPPGNIKVRFFVPETVVGSLAAGRQISVAFDGAARNYQGTISYISPQAEYTPPVIYSRDARTKLVFMIEAQIAPDQAVELHPGQPVDVRLEVSHG